MAKTNLLKVAALAPSAPATEKAPSRRSKALQGPLGVVEQVRVALQRKNRLAAACGFLLGGIVPAMTYVVAHQELGSEWYSQIGTLLVLGGLLYSAQTVYGWGRMAFSSGAKAFGFTVLLEGTLIFSGTTWLSAVALGYLVMINGVATACNLAARK